jgi:hypothetical protein
MVTRRKRIMPTPETPKQPQVPKWLRMRKRHSPRQVVEATAADGERLWRRQSVRDALIAAAVVIILFSVVWAMLSTLLNRIFPWMTVVLGVLVGLAIRRAGQGLDWRFPVIAVVTTLLGALVANVAVAAAFTARALETSTLHVLRAVTAMTWPVFFTEAMAPADVAYALIGAAVAAFYANHRLDRAEFLALRRYRQQAKGD